MKYQNKGFSLIEAMIAMAVMATGLLAVATFQTEMLGNSGTNKARAEALMLAKVQIEGFRNYTNEFTNRGEFDAEYTAGTSSGESITGTNAAFTRNYVTVGEDEEIKEIAVKVAWYDRRNEPQSITLNTVLNYVSPRAAADVVIEDEDPLIPSATGRAHLGDGTYTGGGTIDDNGDGTSQVEENGDIKLLIGTDIVLTLKDACQSGDCTDFVRISGRVYINTGEAPGRIFVKASDAAFCQRYFTISGTTTVVDADTLATATPNTSNGDYEYFDYTCYLGGGWHGNIGIIFKDGISLSDKVCVGDPTETDPLASTYPVIATRRIYRGNLFKIDTNTVTGYEETSPGVARGYSKGIRDGTVFPANGQPGHDFVISTMAASDTTGDLCISNGNSDGPMMQTDSYADINSVSTKGGLFAEMPADFVCLNPVSSPSSPTYLDLYESPYVASNGCPYPPNRDPPSLRHTISGTLRVDGDLTSQAILDDLSASMVETSDGAGNCTIDDSSMTTDEATTLSVNYSCDIYDWGNGWNGFVKLDAHGGAVYCTPSQQNYTNLQTDATGVDFNCVAGNIFVVSGSISGSGSRTLDQTGNGAVFTDSTAGDCVVTATNYACKTNVFAGNDWSGSITFTGSAANDYVCYAAETPGYAVTVTYTNQLPGLFNVPISVLANTNCP